MGEFMGEVPTWFYVVVVLLGVAITLLACMPTKWVEKLLKEMDRRFGRR